MTLGKTPSATRLIISDFGGVICTFDYRIFCDRLARHIRRTSDEVFAAAFGGALQRDFESGRISGKDYHAMVMRRLEAEVPYDLFFPMYGDIFTEVPGMAELLRRLHGVYPLYLLSDTNEIHFGYVQATVPTLSVFDAFIVSYEVGAMKPDAPIYEEALRRSGVAASACVFIDDRPANVEGARRVGMRGVQFHSPAQLASELTGLGVAIP